MWASCRLTQWGIWKMAQVPANQWEPSDCMGEWLQHVVKTEWELMFSLKTTAHSKWAKWLTAHQSIALDQRGHWMPKTSIPGNMRLGCTWEKENPGAVTKDSFTHHFYWLCVKGTTHAMVSLQWLHLGDMPSNAQTSLPVWGQSPSALGVSSWVQKHWNHHHSPPWETHYRMPIMCNICQVFASMSALNILDHQAGCKAKCMTKNMCRMSGAWKGPQEKETQMSRGQKESLKLLRQVWHYQKSFLTSLIHSGWMLICFQMLIIFLNHPSDHSWIHVQTNTQLR